MSLSLREEIKFARSVNRIANEDDREYITAWGTFGYDKELPESRVDVLNKKITQFSQAALAAGLGSVAVFLAKDVVGSLPDDLVHMLHPMF